MSPVTVLVLLLIVLGYHVIGSYIFISLEASFEIERQKDLLTTLQEFEDKYRCLDRKKMMRLMDYIDRDLDTARYVLRHNATYNVMWDWAGSGSFVLSVITTIGYGHITPRTPEGKIACMVYAIVGIPLLLVFLKGAGEILCKVCEKSFQAAKRCAPGSRLLNRVNAILQSLLGLSILFVLPVTVNVFHENWSPLDAIYSCFITLTTIGFGDFVPGNPADRMTFHQSSWMTAFRVINLVWTLVGLAYISMLITAISNYYLHKTHGVQAKAEARMVTLKRKLDEKLNCSCTISTQTDTPSPSPSDLPDPHLSDNVASDLQRVRLLAFSAVPEKSSSEGTAQLVADWSSSVSETGEGRSSEGLKSSSEAAEVSASVHSNGTKPASDVGESTGTVTSLAISQVNGTVQY